MKEFWLADREIYPSLFRVLIGIILLTDLISFLPAIDMIYNPAKNAFYYDSGLSGFVGEHIKPVLGLYGLVLILFILGVGRHIASFLVFVFSLVLSQANILLETWGDVILSFTLMYFVFTDSFRYLAVNRSKGTYSYISKLAVWSILLNLFLIYLTAGYSKLLNKEWLTGYGAFFGFSELISFADNGFWYKVFSNKILAKGLNYIVILQQLLFVPLVIWKKTRYYMLFLAAIIHLIMLKEFGLWKFELIVILLYGFVLTDDEWEKIFSCLKINLK